VTAGVLLRIDKGIPVAGGMAGGSADAAGALVACDALWRTGLDRSELLEIAASLGSDVPFALAGGTALATGRGDLVAPVLARGQFHWVFALAERGLSTAAVYAEYDRGDPVPSGRPTPYSARCAPATQPRWAARCTTTSSRRRCGLRPALRRVLDAGLERGAIGAVVSGSGPTCAFLTRSANDAIGLAASLAGAGVCRSVRRAYGPVAGARIVDPTRDPR
jgi:4-diphosphocytidyl-2-C-methyl-D-erythritol kinase